MSARAKEGVVSAHVTEGVECADLLAVREAPKAGPLVRGAAHEVRAVLREGEAGHLCPYGDMVSQRYGACMAQGRIIMIEEERGLRANESSAETKKDKRAESISKAEQLAEERGSKRRNSSSSLE